MGYHPKALASKVKVACRIRPVLESVDREPHVVVVAHQQRSVRVLDPEKVYPTRRQEIDYLRVDYVREKIFDFDFVFGAEADTSVVFDEAVKPLISHVARGQNVSVFAYGQTGSGKTHSMLGHRGAVGVVRLALQHLFENNSKKNNFFSASFVELYNEDIRDLLSVVDDDQRKNLEIREDPKEGATIAGATKVEVRDVDSVVRLLNDGDQRRTKEPTRANPDSSRSHAILQITLVTITFSNHQRIRRTSKLSMIDLAGSERAAATGNRGQRLTEAARINQSLLALGNVINALQGSNKTFVNFRDSKLTRLLKDSLGGNCRTLMIAHVSPAKSSFEETVNTLKYASRARAIKNSIRDNIVRSTTCDNDQDDRNAPLKKAYSNRRRPSKEKKQDITCRGRSLQRADSLGQPKRIIVRTSSDQKSTLLRKTLAKRVRDSVQLRKSLQKYGSEYSPRQRRRQPRLSNVDDKTLVLEVSQSLLRIREEREPVNNVLRSNYTFALEENDFTLTPEEDAVIRQRAHRECDALERSVRREREAEDYLLRSVDDSKISSAPLTEMIDSTKREYQLSLDAEMKIVNLELCVLETLEVNRNRRAGALRVHELALESLDLQLRLRNAIVKRLLKELDIRRDHMRPSLGDLEDEIDRCRQKADKQNNPGNRDAPSAFDDRPSSATSSPRSPRYDEPTDILAGILASQQLMTAVDKHCSKPRGSRQPALPPIKHRRHDDCRGAEPTRWRR